MGVFTGFGVFSPLFLPPTGQGPQWAPTLRLDGDSYSGVQPLALLELEEEFSLVITHSKNNLCSVSSVSDNPEGLSAPPRSPGAQSIVTHDGICH